jgi:hypothetical protein
VRGNGAVGEHGRCGQLRAAGRSKRACGAAAGQEGERAVRGAGLGVRGGAMQLEALASVSLCRGGALGDELRLGGAVKGASVEAR